MCTQEAGSLSVWNNGAGIPVVIHKEHQIYVPELIFGNLLTGTAHHLPFCWKIMPLIACEF